MADSVFSSLNAVILAGGLGSRLRSVVSEKPKVMAEISGKPFLTFILDQLDAAGVRGAVLCVGYMAEMVRETLGGKYKSLSLRYSIETELLGTGGGLRLALPMIESDPVLALNGDSFIDADISQFAGWFAEKKIPAGMVLTRVSDSSRYGRVRINEDDAVQAFEEKRGGGPGWINAGMYLLRRSVIEAIDPGKVVSLEKDVFPRLLGRGLYGFRNGGRFIDIGTPESYREAANFFSVKKSEHREE